MHEMLINNWLTSDYDSQSVHKAKQRVWLKIERLTRPSLASRIWMAFAWLFMQPIRTTAFTLVLLLIAVSVGHILPTRLRAERWQQTEELLDMEMSVLENETQLLEYVLE